VVEYDRSERAEAVGLATLGVEYDDFVVDLLDEQAFGAGAGASLLSPEQGLTSRVRRAEPDVGFVNPRSGRTIEVVF
jgi:hypothetical protein